MCKRFSNLFLKLFCLLFVHPQKWPHGSSLLLREKIPFPFRAFSALKGEVLIQIFYSPGNLKFKFLFTPLFYVDCTKFIVKWRHVPTSLCRQKSESEFLKESHTSLTISHFYVCQCTFFVVWMMLHEPIHIIQPNK